VIAGTSCTYCHDGEPVGRYRELPACACCLGAFAEGGVLGREPGPKLARALVETQRARGTVAA